MMTRNRTAVWAVFMLVCMGTLFVSVLYYGLQWAQAEYATLRQEQLHLR